MVVSVTLASSTCGWAIKDVVAYELEDPSHNVDGGAEANGWGMPSPVGVDETASKAVCGDDGNGFE